MARLKQRKKILLYVTLSVLVFNIFFNFLQPLESTLLSIVSFPLRINNFLIREIRSIVWYRVFALQNKSLKDTIAQLQSKNVQFDEICQENERLKKIIDFKKQSVFSLVACRVLVRDNYFGSRLILIDKGKNCALKKDLAVITNSGLVGKITEVDDNTSKVMLISDPNLSVAVLIQSNRQQGLLQGSFYGKCKIRYLDSDVEIQPGDIVITSGLGEVFPEGIVVGKILYVGKELGQDLQYAILKPEVNLNQLEEVLVIVR